MSVYGLDILPRSSNTTLRHSSIYTYAREVLNPQPKGDSGWSWTSLRRQFKEKNLEDLYIEYQQKLHNGYFSVFLLMQIILSFLYILILIFSGDFYGVIEDVVIYASLCVFLCFLGFLMFREGIVKRLPWIPLFVSVFTLILLVTADLGLLFYHLIIGTSRKLRSAFPTHIVLSCYIFLPITNNIQSLILGLTATCCELMSLGWVIYSDQEDQFFRLAADAVYLFTINLLGLYFRFLNEITIRRTFLDRRVCVQSTLKLKYEKGQEDQLLLSILPRHIVELVREYIRNMIQHIWLYRAAPPERSPFSRMNVKEHKNVTILYADVVNFSKLTVSMTVTKLVETLNELFSKFDQASEDHNVLRIKFLGDCYYCVSGVPEVDPHHAENCVNLGLDMIAIIKDIREERRLKYQLDMRIGIHSGNIFSGLLGVSKWQYDIWSKDVVIANHMEQAGEPGKVHVTKQTLDFLGHNYNFRPAYGASRNKLLAKYNIETFFIVPQNERGNGTLTPNLSTGSRSPTLDYQPIFDRIRNSTTRKLTVSKTRRGEALVSARRNTLFMDNSLVQYQQTLAQADNQMAETIHKMHLGVFDRWLRREEINPCCLTFNYLTWEIPFFQQPDPLFKYYLVATFFIALAMLAIQSFGITEMNWIAWAVYGIIILVVIFLIMISWTWNEEIIIKTRKRFYGRLIRFFHQIALRISWKVSVRTLIYIPIACALALCVFIQLIESPSHNLNEVTDIPWHISHSVSLAVIMCFFYFKIHFLLKFITGGLISSAYLFCVWEVKPDLFQTGESWHPNIEPILAHTLHVVLLTFSLHLIDRQAEFINRLDYRWKRQLSEEQKAASDTRAVNKMLLRNILPMHVANHYLNMDRALENLYCEEYESVAVMFATLIDFSEDSDSDNGIDKVSLIVLNEIICEFDKLLFDTNGLRIEKIKVAGWTYMAACGLDARARENNGDSNGFHHSYEHEAVVLVRFATQMMKALDQFNKECNNFQQQNFQLRVGISHGPINAGVIGAQKPLYDIWGDTVNVASRMDSTGIAGRIQVTKHTARVLEENSIDYEFRGEIFVKGQGIMPTYFVSLTKDYYLISSYPTGVNGTNVKNITGETLDNFDTKL